MQKERHILLLRNEAESISRSAEKQISDFATRIRGRAPYVFEMKKSEERGSCVFLQENTCSIYSIRPIICQFYPFEMREREKGVFMFYPTEECPGLGKGKMLAQGYFQELLHTARARMDIKSSVSVDRP